MASTVPAHEVIASLSPPLTKPETELLAALETSLGEDWTIYVQPHFNGLRPDFVIFSPLSGVGLIEVSDWPFDGKQKWPNDVETPYQKLDKCYRTLLEHQLAPLHRQALKDHKFFAAISQFVYFPLCLTGRLPKTHPSHITTFGSDVLESNSLLSVLRQKMWAKSKFAALLSDKRIEYGLRNALGYPEHGGIDKVPKLQLNAEQKQLLPNELGRHRRVIGSAGSGKSIVAALKAVDAAASGKNVFLTCYNITMANHLRELVLVLAHERGPHVHRKIEISHFHLAFWPEREGQSGEDRRNNNDPIDVLLVDEGQDFQRSWIELMYKSCSQQYHFMFFGDPRQNVYGVDPKTSLTLPRVFGRPNVLRSSFRVPRSVAALANGIAAFARLEENVNLVASQELKQQELFDSTPLWFEEPDVGSAVRRLAADVLTAVTSENGPHPADVAILVCSIESGWYILEELNRLSQPYTPTFAGRAEAEQLSSKDRKMMHRTYKVDFWMRNGRVKVSTVKSFKGWELSYIYVLFVGSPPKGLELLYTAVTRAQKQVCIYAAQHNVGAVRDKLVRDGVVVYKDGRPEFKVAI